MGKSSAAKSSKLVGRPKAAPLEVCERHLSEHPNKCEELVYEARGAEAKALRRNALCRGCRRPLARVLDRVKGTRMGACSFCYQTGVPVAIACKGLLGVRMEICEGCACDAAAVLRKERGEADDPNDPADDDE